jgi:hypothetical protein
MDWRADIPRVVYQRERRLPFLRRNIERTMTSDAKKLYTSEFGHKTTTGNKSHHEAQSGRIAKINVPVISQRLFDSTTRQPLLPKSRVRNGEDDVDEAWRVSKQIDSLVASHNISETTKDYMKQWNTFMMRLKLSSNIYLAEALTQFVTDEKEWFAGQQDRIREFTLHANVLRLRGIITVDCILDCLSIMRHTGTPSSETNERVEKNKEKRPEQIIVLDTPEGLSERQSKRMAQCPQQ